MDIAYPFIGVYKIDRILIGCSVSKMKSPFNNILKSLNVTLYLYLNLFKLLNIVFVHFIGKYLKKCIAKIPIISISTSYYI